MYKKNRKTEYKKSQKQQRSNDKNFKWKIL